MWFVSQSSGASDQKVLFATIYGTGGNDDTVRCVGSSARYKRRDAYDGGLSVATHTSHLHHLASVRHVQRPKARLHKGRFMVLMALSNSLRVPVDRWGQHRYQERSRLNVRQPIVPCGFNTHNTCRMMGHIRLIVRHLFSGMFGFMITCSHISSVLTLST